MKRIRRMKRYAGASGGICSAREVVRRVVVVLCATTVMVVTVVWFAYVIGFWSWASAFCATWFVVAWMAALRLLVCLRLPAWYYRPKDFERSGRVYELPGVQPFRKFVWRGPLHILTGRLQQTDW